LTNLRERTRLVIDEAKQIKQLGTTGAYSKDFSNMAENIELINQLLANTTISDQDIKEIDEYLHSLRKHLNTSMTDLQNVDNKIDKVYNSAKLDDVALIDLRTKGELVKQSANDLKENATKLQEANIEGALNLTRDAWHRVNLLQEVNRDTLEMNKATEKQCKRTEAQVSRSSDEFDRLSIDNDDKLVQYQAKLDELSAQIPVMNEQVCDKRGDPCDSLCGGAGCGSCGGLSCEKGALSRADKALDYVKDTEKIIKEKEEKAEDLIRSVSYIK
jgi:laminin, beta 1